VEFTLDGRLEELQRGVAEIGTFCGAHGLDAEVTGDLELVLEELFLNAVNHGGCQDMPEAARVTLHADDRGVVMVFADRGGAFDPISAPEVDITAPLEARRNGGLGIHMVRALMSDLRYRRSHGWNELTMRREVPAAQGGHG
jgi:anti-sigma regulatory factor (Ser/Thr protein kinase)